MICNWAADSAPQAEPVSRFCSYMPWERQGTLLGKGKELGLDPAIDSRTELGRHRIVHKLVVTSEADNLTGAQKNDVAVRVARAGWPALVPDR